MELSQERRKRKKTRRWHEYWKSEGNAEVRRTIVKNKGVEKKITTIFTEPEACHQTLATRQSLSGARKGIMSFRNPQRSQSVVIKTYLYTRAWWRRSGGEGGLRWEMRGPMRYKCVRIEGNINDDTGSQRPLKWDAKDRVLGQRETW